MKKNLYQGNPAIFLLGVIIFALDGFNVIAKSSAPERLGHFACAFLPYVWAASPLIAPRLITFINGQCTGEAIEPAISIIFFMIKIYLCGLGVIFYWLDIFISDFGQTQEEQYTYINSKNGAVGAVKDIGPTILGLALLCFYLLWRIQNPNFEVNVFGKFVEDFFCLIFFLTLLLVTTHTLFIVKYATDKKRKN